MILHGGEDAPLALVRVRRYAAGSLGRVHPGGAWAFLLPSLVVGRVQVLGTLDPGALEQLGRLASFVERVEDSANVAHPPDLLVLSGCHPRRLAARTPLGQLARSTIAGGGSVYLEWRTWRGSREASEPGPGPSSPYSAWPPFGPLMGASPSDDAAIFAWLMEHGLVASPNPLEERLGSWMRRRRDAVRARPSAGESPGRRGGTIAARRLARSAALAGLDVAAAAGHGWEQVVGAARRVALLGVSPGVPRYLVEMAGGSDEIDGHRVALVGAGPFRTQKNLLVSFAPESRVPDLITKVGREPAVNERLDAAVTVLREIRTRHLLPDHGVPEISFVGEHAGLRFVGERTVAGRPFDAVTTAQPDCPWAAQVVDSLTQLGRTSRRPTAGALVANALGELLDRCAGLGGISPAHTNRLNELIDVIRSVEHIDCVVQHGDPGPWNIVARDNGSVTMLDWENGERVGMPFWDLAYFARSYGALIARRRGIDDRLERSMYVLREPALRARFRDWTIAYATAVGMPEPLIGPLFYHGLVYQALKETSRLPLGYAQRSIFARTLVHLLEHDRDLVENVLRGASR